MAALSSAKASDIGTYGSAPPSLDYPTSGFALTDAEMRKEATLDVKKNDWLRDELFFLSPIDPFPSRDVPAIDPLSKKKVARSLVGPAFKIRGYGSNYDYYRYVTFFDIYKRKEQIYSLPTLHSNCYDVADLWSNYGFNQSYSASVTASASIEGLGLSASFTKTRTFAMGQQIAARGIDADYVPYAIKQDWHGRTFIELYDSKTGKSAFLDKPRKQSPWWVYVLFPIAAQGKYPMDFRVKDATWMFRVDRENVKACDRDFGAR